MAQSKKVHQHFDQTKKHEESKKISTSVKKEISKNDDLTD